MPSSGRCIAVEDLHQRRLAGAVLADDGVDRAGRDREVDAVVGDHAGEALDDAAAARPRAGIRTRRGRRPTRGGARYVLGHGTVLYYIWLVDSTERSGTVILPSMICCLRSSSCGMMSSRLPPVVE